MSELFANLSGFRKPDVRMNQGPLPSVAGGPVGTDGTPDGVINGSDSLLGNIQPYAYGESARAGSDSNYQQIPHRAQYIVLPLHLPSWDSTSTHKISHAVDNGELAFVLMTRGRQWFSPGENVATGGPISLPLFANLAVVNYILACMQLAPLKAAAANKRSWTAIRNHLWCERMPNCFNVNKCKGGGAERVQHLFECVQYTMQNLFKPHGICAGSEKQGGQHEESWAPVQAAVNYTTTMTVDGQNRDLLNYWHSLHVCAGDRLLLTLQLVNAKNVKNTTQEYQLTSYYKRPVSATVVSDEPYWELVPHILHADKPCETIELSPYDYRLTGYWHIAQSFQGRRGFATRAAAHGGAPLHVTFAPVFVKCDSGARESRYFCEDLLKELELDPGNAFADYQNGRPYEQDVLTVALSRSGVKADTLRTLFTKHGDFIASLFTCTEQGQADNLFCSLWGMYKFAGENHMQLMQKRVLHYMHGSRILHFIHKDNKVSLKEMMTEMEKWAKSVMSQEKFVLFRAYMNKWSGKSDVRDDATSDSTGSGGASRGGRGGGGDGRNLSAYQKSKQQQKDGSVFDQGPPPRKDGALVHRGGSRFLDPPGNVVADATAAFGSAVGATMDEDMAALAEHDVRQKPAAKAARKKCAALLPVAE